jgi:tripartite-type tricarboxylate transporter receptor subunit TctC
MPERRILSVQRWVNRRRPLGRAEAPMMPTRRHLIAAASAGLAAAGTGGRRGALAQVFEPPVEKPLLEKPARIMVGFAAGGGTDVTARILAEALRGAYASTFIVENKPGAAARQAVEYVKNAEPDGSVMLFTPDFPITVYPYSFRSLTYDPVRDLTPVAPVTRSMLTFNIGPAVPESITTLAGFVDWCRANPGKASYATTAAGGTPHFVGVMLANAAGVAITPVHYRGGAPALADLIGGHVAASVNPVSEILAFAKSGTVRTLAVTGAQRSRFLPDIPAMREAGYDVVVDSWSGMFLPAGVAAPIVNALSAAIGRAVKSPRVIESLARAGNAPAFQSPAQFATLVKADLLRWGPVVKASGFVADD